MSALAGAAREAGGGGARGAAPRRGGGGPRPRLVPPVGAGARADVDGVDEPQAATPAMASRSPSIPVNRLSRRMLIPALQTISRITPIPPMPNHPLSRLLLIYESIKCSLIHL